MRKADFATPPLTKALAAPVEMAVFGWKGEATADSCGADKRQSRSSACSPRRRITTKRQRRKQKQIPFGNDNQKSNGLVAGGRVYVPPFAKCAKDRAPGLLRLDESSKREVYINSSMKDLATSAGMRMSWWTRGPGFRTGSASWAAGMSLRSKKRPMGISSPQRSDFSTAA